ncbi:hypothetical protein B0T24DRAFT_609103, partial [Lasiosphaeria ovina]
MSGPAKVAFQNAQYENNAPARKYSAAHVDKVTIAPLVFSSLASRLSWFVEDVDKLQFRTTGSVSGDAANTGGGIVGTVTHDITAAGDDFFPIKIQFQKYDSHGAAVRAFELGLQQISSEIDKVTARPSVQLGQMALQSPVGVTWVWENIVSSVSVGPRFKGPQVLEHSNKEEVVKPAIECPIFPLAAALHRHLESHAAEEEPTVTVSLESSTTGEIDNEAEFTVKLVVQDWLEHVSWSEVEGTAILCTESDGELYHFEGAWSSTQESSSATLHFAALGVHLGVGRAKMTVKVKVKEES